MRVNLQLNTTSYKLNSSLNQGKNSPLNLGRKSNSNAVNSADISNGHISLKRMLQDASKEQKQPAYLNYNNNIISSSMSYSEKLKADREKVKDASLEKKKLRYQFKDISSKIIRSKTSQTARQAVSSARRELLRLKEEKKSGKYDAEEIEAAITHAKAMERAARKKVKHLEEEEMLKASGGPCADIEIEQEERLEDSQEENIESEDIDEQAYSGDYDSEFEDMSLEELTAAFEQLQQQSADTMNELQAMSDDMMNEMQAIYDDMTDSMEEMTSELMDEMEEGMQDMLEQMGLGELADSLTAARGDIDPADYKMMKIKHRCKEMKEITKADSEYLKAVFKYLEKMKEGGGIGVSLGNGSTGMASGGQLAVAVANPETAKNIAASQSLSMSDSTSAIHLSMPTKDMSQATSFDISV